MPDDNQTRISDFRTGGQATRPEKSEREVTSKKKSGRRSHGEKTHLRALRYSSTQSPRFGPRKKSYKPEYATRAKQMCELGAFRSELADEFQVDIRTIDYWLVTEKDFAEACRTDGRGYNNRLRRALIESAAGGERTMEKLVYEQGRHRIVMVRVTAPPNPAAAKLLFEILADKSGEFETATEMKARITKDLFESIEGRKFRPIDEPPRISAHLSEHDGGDANSGSDNKEEA